MNDRDEHELRERFALLRREESGGAPPFRRTIAAARAHARPTHRLALAAAVVLVALVLILTLGNRRHAAADLAGVRVYAPTDFLLQLPGAELLRTVPQLGRVSFDRRTL